MSDTSLVISVEHALQKAVFQTLFDSPLLQQSVGDRIYDTPPLNASFPYIGFGSFSTRNQTLDNNQAYECRFSLNLLSQAGGRKQIYEIMQSVRFILEGQNLVLPDFALVNLSEDLSDVALERDRLTQRGTMRFRAFIELL